MKQTEANTFLEKKLKKKKESSWDVERVVDVALSCLTHVLSADFKPSELEMALVSKDTPRFQVLSEEEIDNYLTVLAERD